MIKTLSDSALAKINLFLRVTGRRSDGYHELDSIFVPVSIHDRLTIELRPGYSRTAALSCDAPGLPSDQRNLALKAALEFMAEFDVEAKVWLTLRKQIPLGAGLGGGSSDAAAVIRMMATLCGIADAQRLSAVALRLGADVPFFLTGSPARVRGIGEVVEPLELMHKQYVTVAVPAVEVSTASVYLDLRPEHWSGAAPESDVLDIIHGRATQEHLVNDLERSAAARWPVIAELKETTRAAGARGVAMTGSGGGVFGLFDSLHEAAAAAGEIRRRAPESQVFAASILC